MQLLIHYWTIDSIIKGLSNALGTTVSQYNTINSYPIQIKSLFRNKHILSLVVSIRHIYPLSIPEI